MDGNAVLVDRRVNLQWRKFVRFEFAAYIVLHAYTCYIILGHYGLLFAVVAAVCPVFPELLLLIKGIMTGNLAYVSVFLIFGVSVVVNATVLNLRDRGR